MDKKRYVGFKHELKGIKSLKKLLKYIIIPSLYI